MRNIKDLKTALKNNCFRPYLIGDNFNTRITGAKMLKGKLQVRTSKGWQETDFVNIVIN